MNRVLWGILASTIILAACAEVEAADYRLRYLESLPGYYDSSATGINDDGMIVGYAKSLTTFNRTPVYWDATGNMHLLSVSSNKVEGNANAVNSNGWMLGRQFTSFDYYGQLTLWKPGGSTQVLPYGDGGAINDAGDIGAANDSQQAIIYKADGTTRLLPNMVQTADTMSSKVCGINNSGVAVGICSYRIGCTPAVTSAVKWDRDGKLTVLSGLNVSGYASLYINDRGDVLDNHGYMVLDDGTTRQLQLPAGKSWGMTMGLNDLGQVVGWTYDGAAMLWDENGIGTPIGTPGTGQTFDLMSINNHGVIAGYVYANYDTQAAVWEPVTPEPASMVALLFGLSGMIGLAARKRR